MGFSAYRPTGLTHHHPARSYKGYTIITPLGGDSTLMLDMGGRIVHRWRFKGVRPFYARLLNSGNLAVFGTDARLPRPEPDVETATLPLNLRVRAMGGNASLLREVDWEGQTVWEYVNETIHHDFVRLPNGNTVLAEWAELDGELERSVRGGRRTRRKTAPMLGDEIFEIEPDGTEVWRVRLWELHDPRRDPICPLDDRAEWTHLNSLDVNEDGDVLFSCRRNSRIGIIDRASGDLKWSYGQPETFHQHNATWLEDGHVQVFDNGMHRFNGNPRSRVIEVDPATNEVVWEYTASPDIQFLSAHISGAERLPNGNVLVCEGAPGRLFEVTKQGEVVWEWINPIVEQVRDAPSSAIFRAHRYGPDHPGIAGRELDPRRFASLNGLHGLGRRGRRFGA